MPLICLIVLGLVSTYVKCLVLLSHPEFQGSKKEKEAKTEEQVGTLGRKWGRRESERGGKNWIQSGAGEAGWTNK